MLDQVHVSGSRVPVSERTWGFDSPLTHRSYSRAWPGYRRSPTAIGSNRPRVRRSIGSSRAVARCCARSRCCSTRRRWPKRSRRSVTSSGTDRTSPTRDRELVTLATGRALGCAFIWESHLETRAGCRCRRLPRSKRSSARKGVGAREAALVAFVRELCETWTVSDGTFRAAHELLGTTRGGRAGPDGRLLHDARRTRWARSRPAERVATAHRIDRWPPGEHQANVLPHAAERLGLRLERAAGVVGRDQDVRERRSS